MVLVFIGCVAEANEDIGIALHVPFMKLPFTLAS
jgi:hypothetical protein